MIMEERIRLLLSATPQTLAACDRALTGEVNPERACCLKLWRMGQAATETGLSRCTLWRAIKEGRLHAVEVRRGSLRIADSELRRFVEGKA